VFHSPKKVLSQKRLRICHVIRRFISPSSKNSGILILRLVVVPSLMNNKYLLEL
jgi:hypothetical protein